MLNEQAIEYIKNALTTGELHMKDACKTLGWSYPRIRSRALTIAKKLNSTLTKRTRGVYYLEPHTAKDSVPPKPTDTTEAIDIVSDTIVVNEHQEDNGHTLDPKAVEAVLMGNTTDPNK
jgi:hypothetical protein